MGKITKFFKYYFSDETNFKKFWNKNRSKKEIPDKLREIIDNFIKSSSYKMTSNYWKYLNIKNIKQIIYEGGIENYANTIALNYFTFFDTSLEMEEDLLNLISDQNINLNGKLFLQHPKLGIRESELYNRLVLKLFILINKLNLNNELKSLSDKGFLGFNDPYITVDSINITSDKLVSLLDYKKIKDIFHKEKINSVLEIGAGSGRFSETFINLNDNTKYIICDIPPAIYINYIRQKKVFNQKKIKLCFDVKTSVELNNHIKNNDILFIFPHQIKFLHESNIDLVIAIDCIHEMDKKTIKYYFENVDKFAQQLYFSVWRSTSVPYSSPFKYLMNKLDAENKDDYQIPDNWKLLNNSKLYFPNNYNGIAYKIK
tara:strand:+ start:562 stop:1677 length:1116 start_codon:yes stop_codon:yes gene_type:complete